MRPRASREASLRASWQVVNMCMASLEVHEGVSSIPGPAEWVHRVDPPPKRQQYWYW